jgi:geranylgeranyl transferase type-2 subunit alpha
MKDPKTAATLSQKAQQWHALIGELARRRESETSEVESSTTLALMEKALLVNPDPLGLWNHRRELLVAKTKGKDETDDYLKNELELTQASLQRNPKAYGAWFHRKWILSFLKPGKEVLENELKLTTQFFTMDERNFHCWNYRRFVVSAISGCWNGGWEFPSMGPQIGDSSEKATLATIPNDVLQSEWEFTQQKIQDNFSNFSAFHYRSQLLPHILEAKQKDGEDRNGLLEEELQLVEDAIFTEPDDQTAWWYHKLLLLEYEFQDGRLEEQAELLKELLEDSPGKWVLLGLQGVLSVLNTRQEEQGQLLKTLIDIDPDRSKRYNELLLDVGVTSS